MNENQTVQNQADDVEMTVVVQDESSVQETTSNTLRGINNEEEKEKANHGPREEEEEKGQPNKEDSEESKESNNKRQHNTNPQNYQHVVDNRFGIISIFGSPTEVSKMVFKAMDLVTKLLIVLKFFTENEQGEFLHEIEANSKLIDSPQLVKMIGFRPPTRNMPVFTYQGVNISTYSYIIIPLHEQGSLLDLLIKAHRQGRDASIELQSFLARSLADACELLHNVNGLAHLDLKPDNIVIGEDNLLLIDFAHAKPAKAPIIAKTGTPKYLAPEVRQAIQNKTGGYIPELVDSFNYGVCLFTIIFKRSPFYKQATENDKYYSYILNQDFNKYYIFNGYFSCFNAVGIKMGILQIIWFCLQPNPSHRPTMTQIKESFHFIKNAPTSLTPQLKLELQSFLQ